MQKYPAVGLGWAAGCVDAVCHEQALRRFGHFGRIRLNGAPNVADLVVLALEAELEAGLLKVWVHPLATLLE